MKTFLAPAKINLFLRVLNKREDGYHNLASLFQTIDLADQIQLELSDEDQFTCSHSEVDPKDNLVLKALALFRSKVDKPFKIKIHLVKNIPLQSGLGGGSSNAAATLNGLNELLSQPLTDEELFHLACQLGSDVPYFLKPGPAYCEGKGEQIKRIKKLESQPVWIVKPPFGLPTPEVYKCLDLKQLKDRDPKTSLESHLFSKGEYYNDLEEAAFSLQPTLRDIKNTLLSQGFTNVILSGSGSSFFCIGQGYPEMPPTFFTRKSNFL